MVGIIEENARKEKSSLTSYNIGSDLYVYCMLFTIQTDVSGHLWPINLYVFFLSRCSVNQLRH